VRALDAQQNSMRCRNQQVKGCTSHQTGKNPGLNSGLPQEAEGETDHLPKISSNCLYGVKLYLSGSGGGMEVLDCVRLYENVS
jgi:hypothetical protein